MREPALRAGRGEVEPGRKAGMIAGCDRPALVGVSLTRIGSLVCAPCRRSSASSVIPAGGLFGSSGAQKNSLWGVRSGAPWRLRSNTAPGTRPAVRRPADLRGGRAAPGRVSPLWRGEARTARLAGRQSPLHEAVRVLRRAALPGRAHRGDRRGVAPGVAHRQGTRDAVHAGAAAPGRSRLPR